MFYFVPQNVRHLETLSPSPTSHGWRKRWPAPFLWRHPCICGQGCPCSVYFFSFFLLHSSTLYKYPALSSLLHRAQNFVSHSFYANPARADMNFFRIDKSRIVHRQSGANAVFVIPGAVAECHLQSGAKHGFGDGYQLKKLLLYPFDKNHDRTISFLGSVANFDEVSTQWVDSSLMFSTRKDGSNTTGKYFVLLMSPGWLLLLLLLLL